MVDDAVPDRVLIAPRSAGAMTAITAAYVGLTAVSLIAASLALFTGTRVVVTVLAVASQLIFLVPFLRGHLRASAVWATVAVTIAVSGILTAWLGSYFLAGSRIATPSTLPSWPGQAWSSWPPVPPRSRLSLG